MRQMLGRVDQLLRGQLTRREDLLAGRIAVPTGTLVGAGLLLGVVYGAFMGIFAVMRTENPSWMQMLATAVKVPLLFLATLCVTFPSLYVFSALGNSRLGAAETLRLLLAAITVNLALLASFGPVTAFFTLSTDSYPFLVVLNVVFFTISGVAGLVFLRRVLATVFLGASAAGETHDAADARGEPAPPAAHRPSRAEAEAGRRIFSVWTVTYGLVGAQMAWILRPFLGVPTQPFTFFRDREANFFEGLWQALRALGDHATGRGTVPWRSLLLFVAVSGCLYGSVMGSFGARPLQALYSACKVPLLVGAATAVCLPNFYVVNVLLGLRDDFSAACRGILAAQATLTVALASLAPVTLLVYASSDHYELCLVWNGLVFAAGTAAGQATLRRHYRPLIAANPGHRAARTAWLLLYVFVAVQLAWVLRPFLGAPGLATSFFRAGAWTNAYVEVAGIVTRLFHGG